MKTLNRGAAEVLAKFEVHACTDVTGYGLLGHAAEIAEASRVGMEFRFSHVPLYREATRLAEIGKFPGGTFANRGYLGERVKVLPDVPESSGWLLFDAQTSGGLLAAVPPDQAETIVRELRAAGVPTSAIVGRVTDGDIITVLP